MRKKCLLAQLEKLMRNEVQWLQIGNYKFSLNI